MFLNRIVSAVLACCIATGFVDRIYAEVETIEQKTGAMKKLGGYFPLYWDEQEGRLWLEISRFDDDFLYITSLASGLGSNDIGLDRGQLGDTSIVSFRRVGPKIL